MKYNPWLGGRVVDFARFHAGGFLKSSLPAFSRWRSYLLYLIILQALVLRMGHHYGQLDSYYQEGLTMFDITRCFGWDTTLAKLIQIKTSNYCIVLQELPPNFCVCFWLCTSANMAPNWPLLVCIGVRSIVKWYGLHLRFKIVQCHVQKIRFLLSAVLFLKLRLKKIRMSNIARADRYGNGQTHVFFKTLYLLNLGRLWPKHSLLSNNHICSMF